MSRPELGQNSLFNQVYQSWLFDRGVESPIKQPCDVLMSNLEVSSSGVIVAPCTVADSHQVVLQAEKLARALSSKSHFSWIIVSGRAIDLPIAPLRSFMPGLTRIVILDDFTAVFDDLNSFKTETRTLGSRPLSLFYGPSFTSMNADHAIKSAFWNQLRSWNT